MTLCQSLFQLCDTLAVNGAITARKVQVVGNAGVFLYILGSAHGLFQRGCCSYKAVVGHHYGTSVSQCFGNGGG